ncbi:MAG: hypothetical protein ACLQU4_11300 [Limisphaerales bacterium]
MPKKAKYIKAAGCSCALGRMWGIFNSTGWRLFIPMMTSKASRAMIKSVLKSNLKFMVPLLFATIGRITPSVNISQSRLSTLQGAP